MKVVNLYMISFFGKEMSEMQYEELHADWTDGVKGRKQLYSCTVIH
jgi:hypothetical protein